MLGRDRAAFANEWNAQAARQIAEELKDMEGPLLPILHVINERFGHINDEAIVLVADVLNLTRAEVQGVVGFYHDFRREPAGRHVVKVCRAEACQSMGSEALAARLERALGISFGEHHARPPGDAGRGLLSRQLRIVALCHGRWRAARPLR